MMPSEVKTVVPRVILDLVERFERNREAYKAGGYNETQVRREFLDPFFKALGWDIDNERGHAEAYKDVIHEDAIKVGDGTRAPDYCFRIGGTRKFFLEAKKPAIDIKNDPSPAFQLRRYAWTTKLPLSILTDFEEFAVYDCRVKPDQKDKASVARILYIPFTEYATRWDEIASVFSNDAVLKGSFDKYAEENKVKRGTAAVDDAFLQTIESWRKALAENLALRNKKLTQRETNFAVQRIIDRIIFLRICEGRGIEDYGKLRALAEQEDIYSRLGRLFKEADDRYNSGLFHFKAEKGRHESPDELTLSLDLDDKLLRGILKGLYYPESPYVFSALPADVLGQVYEQFLGKVIRLTDGHQAKVEDKPEVKKAGGVYYTPTYIVDYIVENTVGRLLEDKTLKQVAALRILDPACGSGSFLLGAYEYLLQWHLKFYTENDPSKWAKGSKAVLVQAAGGAYKLSIAERKRILLGNIYGVDIDSQAVETTKLSLLLKVLEGETQQSLQPVLVTLQERALPDLGDNIKCGNSLIGPDFYRQQLLPLDEEEQYRINVFDWNKEFHEILKGGGFDAVIGNPPYVRQESLSDFKSYFEQEYEAFDGVADLYTYFMEKGLRLLRPGGLFGIIVSSSFLRTAYAEALRRTLKKHAAVLQIVDFGGLAVFANAKDTYVCIPLLAKSERQKRVKISKVGSLEIRKLNEYVSSNNFTISHDRLTVEAWSLNSDEEALVFAKIMRAGKPLGEYVERRFFRGITSGLNEAFVIDQETKRQLIAKDKRSAELIHPLLSGEDIRRYIFHPTNQWIIFTRRGVDIDRYPAIRTHLENWKQDLTPKRNTRANRGRKPGNYLWYEIQDDVAYYPVFEGPKLIFPDICKGPRFAFDTEGHYLANTAYCLGTDDRYLLGVLNSRLFWFAISHISIPFGIRAGEYRYRLIYQYMEKVPIRVIDHANKADSVSHGDIVKLVDQTLAWHKNLGTAKTPQEKTVLGRQISATDAQIDRLVYELYGLTPEEIAIVQSAASLK
jgi:type I restriction-modification system DNA methylase subunit